MASPISVSQQRTTNADKRDLNHIERALCIIISALAAIYLAVLILFIAGWF